MTQTDTAFLPQDHVRLAKIILTASALLSICWGCSQGPAEPQGESDGAGESIPSASIPTANSEEAAGSASQPAWNAWPKPKIALLLTAEQHGYFEPCGCTANQLGGMSRRADLLTKIKAAGWPIHGLDAGGLARRSVRQSAIKLNTTLKALHQLDYVAVGIGTEELQLGFENLLETHMNMENQNTVIPFVSANLTFLDGALDGFPVKSRILDTEGLKIGITSVLSDHLQGEVLPLPEVTWSDPHEAIQTVLNDFETQQVDIRVLLSQATREETKAFAEKFPQFDIILAGRGVSDPDPDEPPIKVGDTAIIEAGRKGKYVGVLAVYPNEEPAYRYQLVSLERNSFDDTQAMIDLMSDYQQELKDTQIVLTDGISAAHPSGATFVGVDKCGECHTEAYDIWKNTPHAHAFESLDPTHKHEGYERLNGINRTFDPECIACHVVGWDPTEYIRFQSGFLNEEFAQTSAEKELHKVFAGVQCENCHGPGSQHVEFMTSGDADVEDPAASVRVTLEQARKKVCGNCHDADNSPNFEFDEYWEKVKHSGLD